MGNEKKIPAKKMSEDPDPGHVKFCQDNTEGTRCGKRMKITCKPDRSPQKQWECDDGHLDTFYKDYDEGQA